MIAENAQPPAHGEEPSFRSGAMPDTARTPSGEDGVVSAAAALKPRYNKNRSEAVKVYKSVDPDYASKGLECDEYPFAPTCEGAAQSIYDPTKPAKNFSALALDATQNGKAGSQLSAYYNANRILDGANDEYDVLIIN